MSEDRPITWYAAKDKWSKCVGALEILRKQKDEISKLLREKEKECDQLYKDLMQEEQKLRIMRQQK